MRQGMRFLVKPGTFINQLQWSRRHWFIVFMFLAVAAIESHIGNRFELYQSYADLMHQRFGFGFNLALWLLSTLKLVFMAAGAYAVATVLWLVGNAFGYNNSRRVLFRRLAIVFTVVLSAYTLSHLKGVYPDLHYVVYGLYAWGAILGYLAIREQFGMGALESIVVGILGAILITTSWHYSNHYFEKTVRAQLIEVGSRSNTKTNYR